jgi:hypothetical protein
MTRCQILPLPHQQVSFEIDGVERLRWHHGSDHPRPFFYPLNGPSGRSLTRMGHPGAPNHDHHLSVWFAHHKVTGVDFWGMNSPAVIRQQEWMAYHDGDDAALMAVHLHWLDGHDPAPLLDQQLVARVSPAGPNETFLELQATFSPRAESLEFGKTNFGIVAVRVAKAISAHFGSGQLTDAEGRVGEPAIFGTRSRWMDYSGEILPGTPEGITLFDHPANPNFPSHWHVREDGWMGPSLCFDQPRTTTRENPLTVRYLLLAHGGGCDPARFQRIADEFASTNGFEVRKATVKHEAWTISWKTDVGA